MPGRLVAAVREFWAAVIIVGASAMALKSAGPVAVGGRPLPPRIMLLVGALAPALLAAFLVTNTFGQGSALTLDARAVGLGAAAAAIALRAPLLVTILLAAAATAIARAM